MFICGGGRSVCCCASMADSEAPQVRPNFSPGQRPGIRSPDLSVNSEGVHQGDRLANSYSSQAKETIQPQDVALGWNW